MLHSTFQVFWTNKWSRAEQHLEALIYVSESFHPGFLKSGPSEYKTVFLAEGHREFETLLKLYQIEFFTLFSLLFWSCFSHPLGNVSLFHLVSAAPPRTSIITVIPTVIAYLYFSLQADLSRERQPSRQETKPRRGRPKVPSVDICSLYENIQLAGWPLRVQGIQLEYRIAAKQDMRTFQMKMWLCFKNS